MGKKLFMQQWNRVLALKMVKIVINKSIDWHFYYFFDGQLINDDKEEEKNMFINEGKFMMLMT